MFTALERMNHERMNHERMNHEGMNHEDVSQHTYNSVLLIRHLLPLVVILSLHFLIWL